MWITTLAITVILSIITVIIVFSFLRKSTEGGSPDDQDWIEDTSTWIQPDTTNWMDTISDFE